MKPWFEFTNSYGCKGVKLYPGKYGLPTFEFLERKDGSCAVAIDKLPKVRSLASLRRQEEVLNSNWFKVVYALETFISLEAVIEWLRSGYIYVDGYFFNIHEGRP